VTDLDGVLGGQGTVGIGIPGIVSPVTGLVKNANSTWLIGQPLDKDLESLLQRPVKLANDANCFAVSEATDGAGEGAEVVFGVIVGTGCGGGPQHVADGAGKGAGTQSDHRGHAGWRDRTHGGGRHADADA
jgi:fructokinase